MAVGWLWWLIFVAVLNCWCKTRSSLLLLNSVPFKWLRMSTKDPVEVVEVKAVLTGNRLYEAILAAAEAWYSKGFTQGNKGFKEFVVQHVQSVEGGEEVTKKKIVDSFGYLVT